MREQFLRRTPTERLERIAANFAQIASCVTEHKPETMLTEILEETYSFCQWAAPESTGELQSLLTNLQQPLDTWRRVWLRLGTQQEFRLAVAREAELWSKRFSAMAHGSTRG